MADAGNAQPSPEEFSRKWRRAFGIAAAVVGLDIAALALGICVEKVPAAFALAAVGVITFVGILVMANRLSGDAGINKAEMRKAIAASFSLVYLGLLAGVAFPRGNVTDSSLAGTVVGHFTWAMGIIIVFYFGSRAVETYARWKYRQESDAPPDEAD